MPSKSHAMFQLCHCHGFAQGKPVLADQKAIVRCSDKCHCSGFASCLSLLAAFVRLVGALNVIATELSTKWLLFERSGYAPFTTTNICRWRDRPAWLVADGLQVRDLLIDGITAFCGALNVGAIEIQSMLVPHLHVHSLLRSYAPPSQRRGSSMSVAKFIMLVFHLLQYFQLQYCSKLQRLSWITFRSCLRFVTQVQLSYCSTSRQFPQFMHHQRPWWSALVQR